MRLPGGPASLSPGHPAPPALRSAGIVTAYNPASRFTDPLANAENDARLLAAIEALGAPFVRTLAGGTGDGAAAWDEPGYAVWTDRETVVRLGTEFGQNAVVWVTGDGDVRLVCARPGFCGALAGDDLGP